MSERNDTVTLWPEVVPGTLCEEPADADRLRTGLASGFDWKALHRCVDEQLPSEQGHSVLELRRLCRSTGLTERLRFEVEASPEPLERAQAARTLMHLREEVSPDALIDLLDSQDPAVVMATAEALALSHQPRLFVPVLRALCEHPAAAGAAVNRLLLFGEDVCPMVHGLLKGVLRQYIDAEDPDAHYELDRATEIDRHEDAHLVAIVEVLARHGYRTAVPTFQRLLGVCENEALHRCLAREVAAAGDVWPRPAAPQRLAA